MLTHASNPTPEMHPPLRRIAHLDMDAFFASVELLRYPQLKGLPLVIGGAPSEIDAVLARRYGACTQDIPAAAFRRLRDYVGRGVITTATYAARAFGIGSAMGLMKAARLCPQAILLPVDFERYRDYSRRFKAVIREFAPVMENRGIDEVYIDFTHVPDGPRDGGCVLARQIQKGIYDATQLTCSIGVAPNKLLAKLASEFEKPNGISIVQPDDLQRLIWPLPCRKLNGIGPKADARLTALGIRTLGDLASCDRIWLMEHFGRSYGAWLGDAAWGRDDSPLITHSEPVSISRETTFARDLHAVRDKAELGHILTNLCQRVAADLQRKGYAGKTIGIKLRYANFSTATRNTTIDHHTADAQVLRQVAGLCLKRVDLQNPLRLLGVRVGQLVPATILAQQKNSSPQTEAGDLFSCTAHGE